ncbi:MAG TPA: aminomethyltransferase family protein, partial [Candidatus Eisenbacteria bacterium]|nr:aminomethyltransferase family protein [Candidatus Eisenbacteria bacterium]
GIFDLSHRALIAFEGADRTAFLQGMLSNDVRFLSPGQGLDAAFLNQQGKILADCRVLCEENRFVIDLWESLKPKILEHLNRYLVADEVEIRDLSDAYGVISVQGPASSRLLQAFAGAASIPRNPLDHLVANVAGTPARVVRYSHTGEEGFDFFVPAPALAPFARELARAGEAHRIRWVGSAAQEVLRVEAGIPRYGADMSEDNILLETGMNRAVSFTKGCYLGQEIIERVRSRGHVNRKLTGLLLDGAKPAARAAPVIASGRRVGTVTSSVFSPRLKQPIALAYIHRDYWTPGTVLTVHVEPEDVPARVTPLPFAASPG